MRNEGKGKNVNSFEFKKLICVLFGHAIAQWLRQCVTNRKVAGSKPDGVIGIFN
jgi:hypothetical protein